MGVLFFLCTVAKMNKKRSQKKTNRRQFLLTSATIAGAAALSSGTLLAAKDSVVPPLDDTTEDNDQQYKIGVCDWMILNRQKLGAFKCTSEIGADGVEVDMGRLGSRPTFDNKLLDPMVRDTINTMVIMRVKNAFLPLGVKGDLVKYPALYPAIVERLKMAGAMAEAAGVVIGIETTLDATAEVELLEVVDSPAIKCYLNFSNALQNDRDLLQEIKILGRNRICQIHCTDEDGVWLENDKRINMPEVKEVLDEIGWRGWLVIERSRNADNPDDIVGNFGANTRYLKSIFQNNK